MEGIIGLININKAVEISVKVAQIKKKVIL